MKPPLHRWLGALAVIVSFITLLAATLPGWPTARPSSALAAVLAGISTYFLRNEQGQPASLTLRRVGLGCALLVGLMGAVTVAGQLGAPAFGIDDALLLDANTLGDTGILRRVSLAAASWTMLGGALALLHLEKATFLAQAVLVGVTALIAPLLLSDLYALGSGDQGQIRNHASFVSLALPTALTFLLVSVGALHAPARGGFFHLATRADVGGQTIRRILPLAVGALIFTAGLSAWGQRRGHLDDSLGAAVIVVAGSLVLATILWRNARLLTGAEAELDTLHANLEDMVLQRTARLRESEQRFGDLFAFAPDAMLITDRLGIITLANRQAEALFGWTHADMIGQPIEMLMPPPLRMSHVELRERYLESAIPRAMGRGRTDLRAARKDGSTFPVDVSLSPIQSKDGLSVVAAVRDLTERRRIDDALRQSEEKYRLLVEGATEVFYEVRTPGDPLSGAVVFVSQSATAVTGYSPDDFVRDPALWARLIHPDDLPLVAESTRTILQSATPGTRSYRILGAVGNVRWIEDYVKPVIGAGGEVIGYQGVARDVTDRRQLEARLAGSQRLDSIGQLAGGVAHDFNNLLTVIIGMTNLTLATLNEQDPIYADLQEVRRAADRATGLTRQLLAFSRRQVLQPEVLDLNAVVVSFLGMLRRLIGEHVEVKFVPAVDLEAVRADPGQIEQVLANLVINARDAMPTGGIVTIETHNVVLDEAYVTMHPSSTPGPHVALVVTDTGAGMDKAIQEKIFEPFFTTKGPGKGTGLGLATVYGIVKQSGGSVWVYSEPGKGSSFKIYLPRVAKSERARPIAAAPSTGAPPSTSGTETILVVEDEIGLRKVAKRILEAAGYVVLVTASGEEALALLDRHQGPLDLVFTDVVMPGLSGRDLAKSILTLNPKVKVLYTSGFTDNAIAHHGVLDEGTNFISKPYTDVQLREAVRRALDA